MWGMDSSGKGPNSKSFCFFGEVLGSLLEMSFHIANFSLSQGQPGSPGLKGESGDLGPQVTPCTPLIPNPVPPPPLSVPINPDLNFPSPGPQGTSGPHRASRQGWAKGE